MIGTKKDIGAMLPIAGRKIALQGLDPKSDLGQAVMQQFDIGRPPAYVLADSRGRVVEKIEGSITAADMRAKLDRLIGRKRK